jgi:hypothetical protein
MMNNKINEFIIDIIARLSANNMDAVIQLDGLTGICPNCHMSPCIFSTVPRSMYDYAIGAIPMTYDVDYHTWFCENCFDTVYTPKDYPELYEEDEKDI